MTSRFLGAGILIGISALSFSCTGRREPPSPESLQTALPGRNELYVSGPDRLTLNEFERLRGEYPKLTSDSLARLALDSQWLARSWKGRSGGTALGDAIRCVRATLEPKVTATERLEAEGLLPRAFGVESLARLEVALAEARRTRVVEWNPDLARELGITAK